MKKSSKNYLWILVANGLLIAGIAVLFQVRTTTTTLGDDPWPVVVSPVLEGDLKKMQVFDPRKTLPPALFLKDLAQQTSLAELRGQWTLLNLWASWCAPCLTELPALQKLNDAYAGKGFRVIAISVDNVQTSEEIQAVVMANKLGDIAMNWDNTGEISRMIPGGALPVTYIIDPKGNVFGQLTGPADWVSEDAFAFVNSLLKP